ncbi:MAG: ABC transporter permease [Candidatus Promineifilaceae bacterium]|nr:ABC transporter permease [Candidatus Promineifilaceae bacterium]
MHNVWTIARRELAAIFVQPIAYIFAIVMVLILGYLFATQLANYALSSQFGAGPPPTLEPILNTYTFLILLAGPAITMRLLAEEQRTGTMELLMTMPVTDGQVVLGKFLAAFIFYALVTALTLIYPLVLLRFGNPDVGPMLSGYLGVLLWGSAVLAIGIVASALTDNQLVAYMIAFGMLLALLLAALISTFYTTNPTVGTFFSEISFDSHLDNFLRGLITATDAAYFLLITAISLFAATRILESRRWR